MKLDGKTWGIIITACISFFTGAYHLIDSNAKAQAELKARDKYEVAITENIRYKFACGCK